jgi:hypothetical protein
MHLFVFSFTIFSVYFAVVIFTAAAVAAFLTVACSCLTGEHHSNSLPLK